MQTDSNSRRLRVRIGPSADTLCTYNVNNDSRPQYIESPYFVGNVTVRVKDFKGHTPCANKLSPINCTEYFGTRRRLFSIQVTGRFLQEYDGDDIVFGAVFESKVSPPTGSWIAMKVAAMIDPAMQSDLYGECPWFLSPMLCSMNAFNVKPAPVPNFKTTESGIERYTQALSLLSEPLGTTDGDALCHLIPVSTRETHSWQHHRHKVVQHHRTKSHKVEKNRKESIDVLPELSMPLSMANSLLLPSPESLLGPWTWGGQYELLEHNLLLLQPESNDSHALSRDSYGSVGDRRKHFNKPTARGAYKFSPDVVYQFDMFAPFINMNTFALSLGLSMNIFETLNRQPIRLVAKSKSTSITFFMVEFALVTDNEHLSVSPAKEASRETSVPDEFLDASD